MLRDSLWENLLTFAIVSHYHVAYILSNCFVSSGHILPHSLLANCYHKWAMSEDDVVISGMNGVFEGILMFCPRRVCLALNDDHESYCILWGWWPLAPLFWPRAKLNLTNYPPLIINKIMIILILKGKAGSLWTWTRNYTRWIRHEQGAWQLSRLHFGDFFENSLTYEVRKRLSKGASCCAWGGNFSKKNMEIEKLEAEVLDPPS